MCAMIWSKMRSVVVDGSHEPVSGRLALEWPARVPCRRGCGLAFHAATCSKPASAAFRAAVGGGSRHRRGRRQPAAFAFGGSGASIRSSPVPSVCVIGSPLAMIDARGRSRVLWRPAGELAVVLTWNDQFGRVLGDLARLGGDFVGQAQQFDLGRAVEIFASSRP